MLLGAWLSGVPMRPKLAEVAVAHPWQCRSRLLHIPVWWWPIHLTRLLPIHLTRLLPIHLTRLLPNHLTRLRVPLNDVRWADVAHQGTDARSCHPVAGTRAAGYTSLIHGPRLSRHEPWLSWHWSWLSRHGPHLSKHGTWLPWGLRSWHKSWLSKRLLVSWCSECRAKSRLRGGESKRHGGSN